jgi:hypothetical protein
MIWLTWRQFRIQALTVYGAVAAFAVVLAVTGPRLVDLQRAGGSIFDQLTSTDRGLFNAGLVVLAVAPALIGAFWGAPLIARELESGTQRLVWNQSVTPARWLAVKLGLIALATATAAGMLTLAVNWWAAPLDGARSATHGGLPGRMTPVAFAMRGIVPVGYAVFALVLGVATGLVLRRSVPAMAVTLAVFTFVQIAVPLWVRPHLAAPVRETVTISRETLDGISVNDAVPPVVRLTAHTANPGDWVLANRTVDASGRTVDTLPSSLAECLAPPPPGAAGPAKAPDASACLARIDDLGYRQQLVYQPADRFWTLQWRETALFLALSGLLTGFCFWWLRRRVS